MCSSYNDSVQPTGVGTAGTEDEGIVGGGLAGESGVESYNNLGRSKAEKAANVGDWRRTGFDKQAGPTLCGEGGERSIGTTRDVPEGRQADLIVRRAGISK